MYFNKCLKLFNYSILLRFNTTPCAKEGVRFFIFRVWDSRQQYILTTKFLIDFSRFGHFLPKTFHVEPCTNEQRKLLTFYTKLQPSEVRKRAIAAFEAAQNPNNN